MSSKYILVIDDNEDLADGLSELMEMYDHKVDIAFTGTAGIEAAAGQDHDFIFIDIGLPDMNGVDCAKRIMEGGARATILLMTGYSARDLPARSGELEGFVVLTKPIDPRKLLDMIG